MAQSQGAKARIVIDTETTFKSDPVSVAGQVLPFASETFRQSRNQIDSKVITSSRNKKKPLKGNYTTEGDIQLELNTKSIGFIMKHFMGGLSTTVYTTTAPGALTSADASVAGNPNGTYLYKVTFYNADGETDLGTVSASLTVSSSQIALTDIPLPSAAQIAAGIVGRKVYRTDGTGAGDYYLLTTIADNTTAAYTDDIADGSLGAAYAADPFAAPYTHTFSVDDLPEGMVVEKGLSDIGQYIKYNGCKISKFSITASTEGTIACSISVLGAKETKSATPYDASPTDLGHVPFDSFEASIEIDGSPIAYASSLSIEIDNGLDPNSYVIGGQGERRYIPVGQAAVSGTLTLLCESLDLYDKAIAGTEAALKLIFTKGTGTGAANDEYLEFYLPELEFKPQAPVIPGPQGIIVELPFIAFYEDSSEATSMQITFKNMVATY